MALEIAPAPSARITLGTSQHLASAKLIEGLYIHVQE